MVQKVKNLPAMQEIWVQSLSWEDILEKGVAAHSSILAWRVPRTEEPAPNTIEHVYTRFGGGVNTLKLNLRLNMDIGKSMDVSSVGYEY